MNATFETIGLEVPSEKAFNYLAERAGDQGEATQLSRRGAVLHGRCWKLGEGLEVWTCCMNREAETFLRRLPARLSRSLHSNDQSLGAN